MTAPAFITVEGIEGVGKSTQMATIARCLAAAGIDAITTREPGGSALADRIRALLLDADGPAPDAATELLLIFAARADHLRATVGPALERGCWVVADRFVDASYAYQGGGREVPDACIRALEEWLPGMRQPDLTLLLDAPVEQALSRARGSGQGDRFERETTAFFERARAKYRERAAAEPERFRVIDASGAEAGVRAAVEQALADFVRDRGA